MLRRRWSAQRITLLTFALVVATFRWKTARKAALRQAEGSTARRSGQVPSRSSFYQMLGTWTAILASLAAVGGLVFTAFSVRYQAEQTGLQVAASRAQTDEQNKQQAQLMNIWAANEFSPDHVLVTVSNRSEEPAYQFRVYIAFATSGSHGYMALSTWSSFPPCTQATFDLRAIARSYSQTAKLMTSGRGLNKFDYGIEFKDAAGQSWHRHASGTLHPTPWLEYLSGANDYNPLLPPVFRSFTPLVADQFTTPEAHSRFIPGTLGAANSCTQSN